MDLFYREMGQGPEMIILHGLYGSSDNWLTFARSISDKFHMYLIDQRNHGQSPHSSSHSFEDMRNDLNIFMEKHNIHKAIITGHSMGGKTAMKFAASFPEKTKALIVLDVSPREYDFIGEVSSRQLNHRMIAESMANLPLQKITSREEAEKELQKSIGSERIRQFLLKNLKRTPEGFEWKINLNVLKNNLQEIFAGIRKEEIKTVSYPSLFVKGSLSDYITEPDYKIISEYFPESEIKTIDGAGHWLHAEKPEELKDMIIGFCEKQGFI